MNKLLSFLVVTILLVAVASAGAQQAPPPPPAYGTPISLEQAKKVMAGAEAEAKKNSWNVAIAIHDSGGNLVMLQRLDGTQFGSTEVAKDKAYSAVAFEPPPAEAQRCQPSRGRDSDRRGWQAHRQHRRLRCHLAAGRPDREGGRRQPEVGRRVRSARRAVFQ